MKPANPDLGTDRRKNEREIESAQKKKRGAPDAMPWVSAMECQPAESPQGSLPKDERPLDEVDEALMESFPCSDPPGYTNSHA